MYLQTNAEFPYCGHHHMFEMDINGVSPKTAGDILILIDGEKNNSTKELLKWILDIFIFYLKLVILNFKYYRGADIKPSDKIKRIFVTEHDFLEIDSIVLNFNRKSKPLFGKI